MLKIIFKVLNHCRKKIQSVFGVYYNTAAVCGLA